ncbi:cobaltochelatase CobT-related protein [Oceanimonas doudoroffii]|uniref:Cobalamin biosynthesis protein CobT n=1 Tax=Oceanimonas doudoroffii TaxID=84158 RepID=A0A233RJY3_9GAMM|nr:cobalamin biosynthesis protein CobT [Oceanimonas doudoroffii]OXY83695.1 cobalamin biosynthesis protein CobT [Oceanimonas doudoroffii]
MAASSHTPQDAAAEARRQQRLEELCAALIRAQSAESEVRYRGHRLEWRGKAYPLRAPHLQLDSQQDDWGSCRGVADAIALRLRHHDGDLHRHWLPAPPVARLVFELLEQLRVESLVPAHQPGSRRNLHHRFSAWSNRFLASGQTESHLGLLLFSLSMMSWVQLGGGPIDEGTEHLIESTRMFLLREIGQPFGRIRRHREEQAAFAEQAQAIALTVSELVDDLQQQLADGEQDKEALEQVGKSFGLLLDLNGDGDEGGGEAGGAVARFSDGEAAYRVFTNHFDKEWQADKKVRPELLERLREQLDLRIREQGLNLNGLTKKLRRLLARPQNDGWRFGEEEGQLDGRRLSTLVTSHADRRVFKQPRDEWHANATVTILVDNSGSMRTHMGHIAMLIDLLVRALERTGARTEVLGFTTGHWNGGKPLKEWQRRGRPANPGRLNERCHLVYKGADTSWRRARRSLAALLKGDMFREGLDGEALLWAEQRLLAEDTDERLLLVISDGCPMDTATRQYNNQDILDSHLIAVADRLEREQRIRLCALGVGLDLSRYYRHNQLLDLEHSPDNRIFDEILALLGRTLRGPHAG